VTNVLVVTTTVGVVNGVHGNTSGSWPRVPLGLHGVVLPACLQEWLVDSTTTGNDTNNSSASRVDDL
jgi:hypothetical protein